MNSRRARHEGLTDEFWAAAAAGRLVRPVCGSCGRSFFTPRWSCPYCRSEEWNYQESSGTGTVYSATVVERGPDETWSTPYTLAIIDLDEGWSMLSRLFNGDGPALEPLSLGHRVSVRFVPEGREPHRTLPVFDLDGEL